MAMLNARCDRCGQIFPSGIVVENSTNITMMNVTAGPCPRCGGTGKLVLNNRTFDVVGEELTVRGVPQLAFSDFAVAITSLATFPGSGRSKKATEDAIVKVIPELAPEVKGQGWTRDDLWNIIQIILAFFQIWQTQAQPEGVTREQMNTLIQEIRSLKASPSAEHHLHQAPHQEEHSAAQDEPEGHQ